MRATAAVGLIACSCSARIASHQQPFRLPCPPQNGQSKINQAIFGLPCKLRLLLTGTPIQNDLSEFYAMVRKGSAE